MDSCLCPLATWEPRGRQQGTLLAAHPVFLGYWFQYIQCCAKSIEAYASNCSHLAYRNRSGWQLGKLAVIIIRPLAASPAH